MPCPHPTPVFPIKAITSPAKEVIKQYWVPSAAVHSGRHVRNRKKHKVLVTAGLGVEDSEVDTEPLQWLVDPSHTEW